VSIQLNGSTIVKLAAIISLTIICVVAVLHGIDSVLIGTVSAIIGGIAGYEFRKAVVEKQEREAAEGQ
jgi:uncharacterized membrane protein required for colicin V production